MRPEADSRPASANGTRPDPGRRHDGLSGGPEHTVPTVPGNREKMLDVTDKHKDAPKHQHEQQRRREEYKKGDVDSMPQRIGAREVTRGVSEHRFRRVLCHVPYLIRVELATFNLGRHRITCNRSVRGNQEQRMETKDTDGSAEKKATAWINLTQPVRLVQVNFLASEAVFSNASRDFQTGGVRTHG